MRHQDKLSFRWFLRHPLVATCILLALTVLLPFLRFGERLKLMGLWPLAAITGEPGETALTDEQRAARDLRQAREDVVRLAHERDLLARALADARSQSVTEWTSFADVVLPRAVDARVVLRGDSSSWRHSLVINRGRKHGLREGMPVVSGRTLAGRVFLAADEHAVVQLLTDPGFAASCVVLDPSTQAGTRPVRAVLRGDGSQTPRFPRLELEDVEVGAKVKAGMLVATSDFSGQAPAGLAVGEVTEVIPQAGFLEVRVKAHLNIEGLTVVQVLLHERPAIESQAMKLVSKGRK